MSTDLIKHTTTSTVIIDNNVEIPVEIATDPVQGLSGRDELAIGTGMFFDLDGHPVITMRGMKFSLDIIWISDDKKVVDISRSTLLSVLGNDTLYSPKKPAAYALEINAGEAQKRGISVDDDVEINLLPNSGLTRLLVLEEVLDYLVKAVPGEKLEYLKPGEKAPRGIQVQRGARGGRGYYPSEVTAVEEETAVLEEPTEEREIDVVQAPKVEPEDKVWQTPEEGLKFIQERINDGKEFYRGHKQGQVMGKWETFISTNSNQAEQFARQSGDDGEVTTLTVDPSIKIYPKPLWWQEYAGLHNRHQAFPGYDAVPVVEPNGDSVSLAVLNSDVLQVQAPEAEVKDNPWDLTRKEFNKKYVWHHTSFDNASQIQREGMKKGVFGIGGNREGFPGAVTIFARRSDVEALNPSVESFGRGQALYPEGTYSPTKEWKTSLSPDKLFIVSRASEKDPYEFLVRQKAVMSTTEEEMDADKAEREANRSKAATGGDITFDAVVDQKQATDKTSSDNLSKLLALTTGLEYLTKADAGKREYLAPGEKAPEGYIEQPGSRPGVRFYVPGKSSKKDPYVPIHILPSELPEEEREVKVVTPEDAEGVYSAPSPRLEAGEQAAERDDSTSNLMESPNAVNAYLDVVSDKLETRLKEIVGEGHKPFLGQETLSSKLTADYITTVGYTDGSKEGDNRPSGLGINSYENFTVTIASGFLGRQKKQFIYKMVEGESRGELVTYAIDRVLGLNVVPFVKQHSMDFFMLNDKFTRTHGVTIADDEIQALRRVGVGGRAGGHFQEFCSNCISKDERDPVMAKMLSTAKGREEFFKVMLLDYIVGNNDRHTGNYLITEDEKIVAIDNGFAGGMESLTPHQNQALLYLNPKQINVDLTFPYGMGETMRQIYPDLVLTDDTLKDEAGKLFDKYFDKGKLDAVLGSINWKLEFKSGGPVTGQAMEDSEQTIAQFKDNFIQNAAANLRRGFIGYGHNDLYTETNTSFDEMLLPSLKPRSSVLKRELAAEGININVIHSLGFDGNPMVDMEEPNIYEEDEFN